MEQRRNRRSLHQIARVQIQARRAVRLLKPDFSGQPREPAVIPIVRHKVRMQIIGMKDRERFDLRREGRQAQKQ